MAYSDKGSGNGMHDLARDTVNMIDGTVSTASAAGKKAHFAADITKSQLKHRVGAMYISTAVIAGDYLYVLTNHNEAVAVERGALQAARAKLDAVAGRVLG